MNFGIDIKPVEIMPTAVVDGAFRMLAAKIKSLPVDADSVGGKQGLFEKQAVFKLEPFLKTKIVGTQKIRPVNRQRRRRRHLPPVLQTFVARQQRGFPAAGQIIKIIKRFPHVTAAFFLVRNRRHRQHVQFPGGRLPAQNAAAVRIKPVVCVQKLNVRAFRLFQGAVAGRALPRIALCQNGNPGIFLRIRLQNGSASVGRAVVDANNLNIFQSLANNAVQTLRQILFRIIRGNDNSQHYTGHRLTFLS